MGQSENSRINNARIQRVRSVLSRQMLVPIALTCLVGFSGCSVSGLSAGAFWRIFAGLPAAILAAPPGPAGLPAPPATDPAKASESKAPDAKNTDVKNTENQAQDATKNPDDKSSENKNAEEKKPDMAAVTSTPNANGFLMATEIILAGKNPFAVKLPKPKPDPNVAQPPGGQTPGGQTPVIVEKPLPPPDPFAQITLNGVLYNPRTPLALISAGGDASKIVRKGDILMGTGGPVIVTAISPNHVEVATLSNRKNKRVLTLPDIVGYIPQGGSSKKDNSAGPAPQSNDGPTPPDSGAGLFPPGTAAGPPGGISEGFPPVSGGKQKGPSINLKPILAGLETP
jgi:hypothetical protein